MSVVPNFLVMVLLRGMSGFFLASLRQRCTAVNRLRSFTEPAHMFTLPVSAELQACGERYHCRYDLSRPPWEDVCRCAKLPPSWHVLHHADSWHPFVVFGEKFKKSRHQFGHAIWLFVCSMA